MRLGRWSLLGVGIVAAACSPTIGPVVPSIQVLVVLDSLDDTLRVIPVDTPDVVHKVVLNYPLGTFGRHAMAVNGPVVAISHGGAVLTANIVTGSGYCDLTTTTTGAIASLAFDNGFVYAAIPATNRASYFGPFPSCNQGGVLIRGGPRAFVSARTTLFVVAGDKPDAPSWLSTSNGQTNDNTPLAPQDSIPLSLPGHARGAVLASDGSLYVINGGSGAAPNARLSQVDPVQRVEQNVYNGFGTVPQYIATDGDRVFVASTAEGLMVYNTRSKQVERDFNSAIPLFGVPRGLAADDIGRVYALIAGPCNATAQGSIRVFGADLVYKRGVTVGRCPVAIGVTDIPTTLYRFDN